MLEIDRDTVLSMFDYDSTNGRLIRKTSAGSKRIGTVAGCTCATNNGKKYTYVGIKKQTYLLHRIIWLIETGVMPQHEIDHINGDSTDNRFSNLRHVTTAENHKNYRMQKNNKSGVMGVSFQNQTRKWIAYIMVNKKHIHLGSFDKKEQAVSVRKSAEIKHGFHRNHGAPA